MVCKKMHETILSILLKLHPYITNRVFQFKKIEADVETRIALESQRSMGGGGRGGGEFDD